MFFKSAARKAQENKAMIRQNLRELTRWVAALEKKKASMIESARTARAQGLTSQYNFAFNALKMLINHQKRARAMKLQVEMVENLRDLSNMSSDFFRLFGKVGKEVSDAARNMNYSKNLASFETGMTAVDQTLAQLQDFMDEAQMTYEEMPGMDEESGVDDEIRQLIDVTGAMKLDDKDQVPHTAQRAGAGLEDAALDEDIERRLQEIRGRRANP